VRILLESKDRPQIGEREYIKQGDRIEQSTTPIPMRLKFQADDTTETTVMQPMEAMPVAALG
jgi:hypothetical protein